MNELKSLLGEKTATAVIEAAKSGLPILITGRQGPTGKSTLCKILQKNGYEAAEVYEKEESNNNTAHIVITLNQFVR